jgi:hypothetical protein
MTNLIDCAHERDLRWVLLGRTVCIPAFELPCKLLVEAMQNLLFLRNGVNSVFCGRTQAVGGLLAGCLAGEACTGICFFDAMVAIPLCSGASGCWRVSAPPCRTPRLAMPSDTLRTCGADAPATSCP